jgi:hypothetical protein
MLGALLALVDANPLASAIKVETGQQKSARGVVGACENFNHFCVSWGLIAPTL